jgi:hypothetical protein
MRRISLVIVVVAIILLGLVTLAFGQEGEQPDDLSPVEGKFKVVFRNCLGTEVHVDLKADGLDFWEDRIEPNTPDTLECPQRITTVRPAKDAESPWREYGGTMATQQHGEAFSVTYGVQAEPEGVVVISFYTPKAVDINRVSGQGIPTPTPTLIPPETPIAPITSTMAPAAAPAQPAAAPTAPLPVSGDEESPVGSYKVTPADVAWVLVLVGGLLVLVSRLVLKHKS